MPRAYRTDKSKYEGVIKEAKRTYFKELLLPYVKDNVLDTKMLKAKNPKLYEEFRLAFKGIRIGCNELGFHSSSASMRAKIGSFRKQAATLALAYIDELGAEAAAARLGAGVESIVSLKARLQNPPARKAGRKSPGRPKKK